MTLPPPIGTVLATAGGATTTLTPAWAKIGGARFSHQHHRAPYGEDWWVSGTGEPEPLTLELTIMAFGVDIAAAAASARAAIAALEGATTLALPYGLFVTLGLLGWSVTPVEAGYRINAQVTAEHGRPQGFHLVYGGDAVTFGGDRVAFLGG